MPPEPIEAPASPPRCRTHVPTASELVADLSRTEEIFILAYLGVVLDDGRVFNMRTLRAAIDAAREHAENVQRLVTP